MDITTYEHPQLGTIRALPDPARAMADWTATSADGTVLGYVTDTRADDGATASGKSPRQEGVNVFEAWGPGRRASSYITTTHSLRGALAAIGNSRRAS